MRTTVMTLARNVPFCTLFILSKLTPAASFCLPHAGRPLILRPRQATSSSFSFAPLLGRFQPKPSLSKILRFYSVRRQTINMAAATLQFGTQVQEPSTGEASPSNQFEWNFSNDFERAVVVVGKKEVLQSDSFLPHLLQVDKTVRDQMLGDVSVGDSGATVSTYVPAAAAGGKPTKLVLAVLPSKASRHNSAFQPHAISSLVGGAAGGSGNVRVVMALEEDWQMGPVACAIARAFPLYSKKQAPAPADPAAAPQDRVVGVSFVRAGNGAAVDDAARLAAASVAAEAVRFTARLVDTPPAEMDPELFVAEARSVAARLDGVRCEVVSGRDLADRGYGGLWGVGKAAEKAPSLVVLSYEPPPAAGGAAPQTVCLVGKGIIYDTGGLSIKVGGIMCTMKSDMGGAAGMLGAFEAAVRLGCGQRLHAVLCVAENAIGPAAFRNDDVLVCYSGKCVEINNTDAEGRLVLADGVAHACKHLKPDLIIDMATLTGAQGISTGKKHAAILANTADIEATAVAAGLRSGDLVHPLVYCPEFFLEEFKSKVADMKNSVKDRSNAQSSCAGHFIEAHLDKDYKGGWLHVDMAYPCNKDERATGYGVALMLTLLKAPNFA